MIVVGASSQVLWRPCTSTRCRLRQRPRIASVVQSWKGSSARFAHAGASLKVKRNPVVVIGVDRHRVATTVPADASPAQPVSFPRR